MLQLSISDSPDSLDPPDSPDSLLDINMSIVNISPIFLLNHFSFINSGYSSVISNLYSSIIPFIEP